MIGTIIKGVTSIVDQFVEDEDQKNRMKEAITAKILENETELVQAQAGIIKQEQERWLSSSWRPITMLFFVFIIGAHWFGFTPENINQETVNMVLEIVKIGLGGYVIGRSGEKIVKGVAPGMTEALKARNKKE